MHDRMKMTPSPFDLGAGDLDEAPGSLLDLLDRVLDKGIVLSGDLTITLADVPLLYLGLDVVICSPDQIPDDLRRSPIS